MNEKMIQLYLTVQYTYTAAIHFIHIHEHAHAHSNLQQLEFIITFEEQGNKKWCAQFNGSLSTSTISRDVQFAKKSRSLYAGNGILRG